MIILIYLSAILSGEDVGTTMYPLLKIGLGPRAAAMGESFTGLADDLTASYWNPAGLAALGEFQFFLSHQEWFQDIRDEYLIAGLPVRSGFVALSALYSSVPDVEIWDDNNDYLGQENLWSGVFALSYGGRFGERLCLGITGKTLMEDLHEESLFDIALDLGGKIRVTEKLWLGGTLKDLSYKMTIPSEIKLGGCYQGLKNARLVMDLVLPVDNTVRVSAGGEYDIYKYFTLRAGWRSGPYSIDGLGWLAGLTSGFGFRWRGLRFDYAFVPYGKLGLTHRLSLSGGLAAFQGVNSLMICVYDGDTKEPLAGRVTLTGVHEGLFDLGQTGRLRFRNIPSGWVYINTLVNEYPQHYDSVWVYPEGEAVKNIMLFQSRPGMLRGIVYDAVTKQPIGSTVLYQGGAYGKILGDSIAGSFVLKNLPAAAYSLTISGLDPKYIPQTCSLTIEAGKLVEREFYLVRQRAKIILRGVNFDTGKAELKPGSYPVLDEAGQILLDNPDIVVEVSGHTDPREISTSEYPSNWELSFARAEVVVKYLIDKFGVSPERLSARGYADTQPIAPNTTEEGMAQNRRTEFKIAE